MNAKPIFIYSSWRTGGTAFIASFKRDTKNIVFYDPLNPALRNFELALKSNSDGWNLNHPSDFTYYDEYLPLFSGETSISFPDLAKYKFKNSSSDFRLQLTNYINELMLLAEQQGRTPIFKFEQLEGHVELLRSNFPTAFHLGLARNPEDQLDSWLEQIALGNRGFFDYALNVLISDKDFFDNQCDPYSMELNEIFDTYYAGLIRLRPDLDAVLDLYENSFDEFLIKLGTNKVVPQFERALNEFKNIESRPSFEVKFKRMRNNSILITQQRDELTQQRDELTQQRDELTQQRDMISNSRIWRFSKPLRDFVIFLKR